MKPAIRCVFKGRLLQLFKVSKELPNGKVGYFEQVRHPGAALIVPFKGGRVVMIRQYRGVIERYLWELPAGTKDHGETPYSCAKREVTEETGYKVKSLKKLGVIFTTPGFCDEVIHIYRAECGQKGKVSMDKDEMIKAVLMTKKEILKLFKNRRIIDAKTIAALKMANVI